MQKSPLLRLFRTLDGKERRQMRKLIRSSFFNQRDDVVRLFDHIDKQINQSDRQLSKEKTFKKVFPDKLYDDGLLRHTMSFLLKKIKTFLVWTEVGESEIDWQIHLSRNLRRRGLTDLFHQTIQRAENELLNSQNQNAMRHLQLFHIKQERYEAATKQQRRGDMGLQQMANEFATYFAANLLRQACGIATHQAMTRQQYDVPLLPEVIDRVRAGEFAGSSAVQLYFHAYQAQLSLDNEEHFKSLRKLLEIHWQAFPVSEGRDLFLLAINFCIKKMNSGVASYRRDALNLYRSGLERGVLLQGGVISPFTYNNVMTIALLLGEWDWTAAFLEKYKPLLPEAERENTYQFNTATLLFWKKDYRQAMKLLRHVEFKDKLHRLDARRMLLRMYFETGELDALESLLGSFEAYIRRQKDLGYHGENYLNLIRFVRRLQAIPISDKEALDSLSKEIKNTAYLAERPWLLSMAGK